MPRIRSANISQNILTGTLNVSTINVSTITLANGQDLAGTGNLAYNQANAARDQANSAYGQANDAYSQANSARNQANSAYSQANAAYLAANNANLLLGGVITGTLNVTQDIIVGGNVYLEGNTTFINVATYSVEDSLIYLASNNSLTDSVDIGFVGAKNTSGTFSHTGLARDATDGKWKLFDGLPDSGHVGNVIDFNNSYLATLVANVEANTLSVVNGVSGNVNFDTGTLFIDSVGNEVGIGTTSPEEQLHIFSGNLLIGTNVNTGFSAAQFRIGATGADVGFQFSQAMDNHGAPRVFFSKARGTLASPTTVSTSDQTGSLRFTGYVGSTGGYVQNAQIAAEVDGAVSDTLTGLGGRLSLWTRQIGGVLTERLRIDNAGNVGIGTTSPAYRVQINRTEPDALGIFRALDVGAVGAAGTYIDLGALSGSTATAGARIVGVLNNPATSGYITFNTLNSSTMGERMIITAAGNVGIGTTNPETKLHVESNGNTAITVHSTTGSGQSPSIRLQRGTWGTDGFNDIRLYNTTGGFYVDNIDSAGAATNLLTATTTGLGIGTTTPSQKLHVAGGNFLVNNNGSGDTNSGIRIVSPIATTHYNWMLAAQQNVGAAFEITPSTAVGGTTFSTPVAVFTQAGQVGIGTASPRSGYLLDVRGNIIIPTGNILAALNTGTGANWGLIRGDNSGNAILGDAQTMYITSGGNVGIGTSPSFKFHIFNNSGQYATWIEHNVNNAGQNFYDALFLQNANAGDDRYVQIGFSTNSSADGQHHRATIRAYRDTDATYGGKLGFFTRANGGTLNERITINAAGNVGIGYTSPQKKLDVNGSGIVASFGGAISVGSFAGFHFGYSESFVPNDIYKKSALVFERTDAYGQGGNAGGKIHFLLNNTGSASASALSHSVMTIDSDGSGTVGSVRLGIGTRNPAYHLVISNAGGIGAEFDPTGIQIGGGFGIQSYNRATAQYVPFQLYGSAIYLMGGNVGVGTTSPGYVLDVNGVVRAERYRGINSLTLNSYQTINPGSNVFLYSQPNDRDAWLFLDSADTGSNWGIYHRQIDSTVLNLPANSIGFVGGGASALQAYISLANGNAFFNGNVGIGTTNPGSYKLQVQGDMYVTGTLTEGSSITLKENIDPITNALDLVTKLVGVTYDRKDGSGKNRAGLIAEEVDLILPNVVKKDENGNASGIQYTNLIAYLIESIKELKAEIDELKRK